MPLKKKAADTGEAGGQNKPFSWTPENDRTLLLLSLSRNIGPADYEKFVTAMPAGASYQGVRQRISKLRMEQKAKYEELGWELTTEATAKTKAPATPKKRKDSQEAEAGEGMPAKAKKQRAKKASKSEETAHDDDKDVGDVKAEEGVKEEQVDKSG
ncbi:hypothetical protein E8E11_008407 [Didymella keratinophila]|nr:hypothetical protein E8E11_008407 [Didymella keratinophila]